ncbi:O-antigen ligase family protein [Mariniflexile sp. HMF6888]|uniref:O-antigen ligase family protein n=1 Tax=Mariniflexile sp. HMF6888 TaxID=3373086 RepID=UPI00378AD68A
MIASLTKSTKCTLTANVSIVVFFNMLLLVIPQINIKLFIDSTITSKFILFIYSLIVLAALSLIHILFTSKLTFKISKLDYALVFFIVFILINRYLVQDISGFSIRYFELIGLSFAYIILRNIPVKYYYVFLLAIIISGIIQAIYGNLQLLGLFPSNHSKFNITGSFFNPGPYAGFLACIWSLSLGMYLFRGVMTHKFNTYFGIINKRLFEVISLLGIISTTLVIPATRSRSAILAMIVSGGFLLMIKYRGYSRLLKNTARYKKHFLLLSLVILFIAVFFGGFQLKQESANGRLLIWKISKNIVADNPLFGVGFDNFKAHYMNYQADYFLANKNPEEIALAGKSVYAFNEFIQLIVENGIIGLVFLVIIIYLIFSLKLKYNYSYLGYLAKGSILAIAVFAFFSYPTQILPIKLILVVSFGLIASFDRDKKSIILFKQKNIHIVFKGIFLLAGIVLIYKTYSKTDQLTLGFKIWKEARYSFSNKLFNISVDEYGNVLHLFNNNGKFLEEYGRTLSLNENHVKAIQILEKAKKYTNSNELLNALGNSYKSLGYYRQAELSYKKSAYMMPSLFYPNYLLAKLYEESGQSKKALNVANKILKKEIKIPSKAIDEIKAEMEKIIIKYELKTSGF